VIREEVIIKNRGKKYKQGKACGEEKISTKFNLSF
jgi:hypothetical protein